MGPPRIAAQHADLIRTTGRPSWALDTRIILVIVEANAATGAISTSDDITDRLLTAAIDVFTERSIEKAGVALIARRAGLTTRRSTTAGKASRNSSSTPSTSC